MNTFNVKNRRKFLLVGYNKYFRSYWFFMRSVRLRKILYLIFGYMRYLYYLRIKNNKYNFIF